MTGVPERRNSTPLFSSSPAFTYFEEYPVANETETGKIIVETFSSGKLDPMRIPGVLVYGHGPFCWGKEVRDAFDHTVVLEKVARMAYRTRQLNPVKAVEKKFLDRYFFD